MDRNKVLYFWDTVWEFKHFIFSLLILFLANVPNSFASQNENIHIESHSEQNTQNNDSLDNAYAEKNLDKNRAFEKHNYLKEALYLSGGIVGISSLVIGAGLIVGYIFPLILLLSPVLIPILIATAFIVSWRLFSESTIWSFFTRSSTAFIGTFGGAFISFVFTFITSIILSEDYQRSTSGRTEINTSITESNHLYFGLAASMVGAVAGAGIAVSITPVIDYIAVDILKWDVPDFMQSRYHDEE